MIWAFSDESRRPGVMYLGVVVIETHQVHDARRAMRAHLLSGQRRLHLTDERSGRRAQILGTVAGLPVETLILRTATSATSIVRARQRLLTACVDELSARGVARWTLDGVEAIQRDRDRGVIAEHLLRSRAELQYDHEPSTAEPLLWAADALTWAAGSGLPPAKRLAERSLLRDIDP
jgi:hypothetical protein